jgi:hypothetical protein
MRLLDLLVRQAGFVFTAYATVFVILVCPLWYDDSRGADDSSNECSQGLNF